MRERELKPLDRLGVETELLSLPMRERELKPKITPTPAQGHESLPMRERELKHILPLARREPVRRSPCGSVN